LLQNAQNVLTLEERSVDLDQPDMKPLDKLRMIVEQMANNESCFVYDVELVGLGNNRTLRIMIEKNVEGGVSIDDCAKVSRSLNEILDTQDPVPGGAYLLEVSSPGLERVLKTPAHYQSAVGKTILVRTFAPLLDFNPLMPDLGKAKQVEGRLISFDEKGLQVSLSEEPETNQDLVFVPFETITKAHVSPFSVLKGQGKSSAKKGKAKK
jgi:ribosome maturation factor RimP